MKKCNFKKNDYFSGIFIFVQIKTLKMENLFIYHINDWEIKFWFRIVLRGYFQLLTAAWFLVHKWKADRSQIFDGSLAGPWVWGTCHFFSYPLIIATLLRLFFSCDKQLKKWVRPSVRPSVRSFVRNLFRKTAYDSCRLQVCFKYALSMLQACFKYALMKSIAWREKLEKHGLKSMAWKA